MKNINFHELIRVRVVLLLLTAVCCTAAAGEKPGWQREEVDWYLTGGNRIKAVLHPKGKPPLFLKKHRQRKLAARRKKMTPTQASSQLSLLAQTTTRPIVTTVIDSPPINGLVPWIVVIVTDKRSEELDLVSVQTTSIDGNSPPGYNPQTDYVIGIFDTGASAHLMGNAAAIQSCLFPDLVSDNSIWISGVVDYVETWVSQPLGIFIDGLGAISPGGLLTNTSGMVGQTNVSILVGQSGGSVELPTAIGSPLAVYYTAVFYNDQQITITRNNEQFTAPTITFHEHNDSAIPSYSKIIPLELRPLGGHNVQYIPDFDIFGNLLEGNLDFDFSTPQTPSTIIGNLSQSVFFVHSVDTTEGGNTAFDKNRFMFDTGAQVTVIGSRIAARLGLDPCSPEFMEVIQGVTGKTKDVPGFHIDLLQIPALGEWLTFTNVPVILLDIASAEGGTLDGIIGMNLFTDFNFVLRGGGLFLEDDPKLEFEPIAYNTIADIAPANGDGTVDLLDLATFVQAWLATPSSPNWNSKADMAPYPSHDGRVDLLDFAVLADYWLETTTP